MSARRAATLIEAIAAMVILTIGLAPVLASLRTSTAGRIDPVLVSRARWLAVEKLEEIVADRHSDSRGYGYVVSGNYAAEPNIANFTGFSRSVSITETDVDLITPGTGYKVITITVDFFDARGESRSLDISTVVTEYAS